MVHLGREKGKAEGKGGMRNGTKKYEHTEGGQKESNRNSPALFCLSCWKHAWTHPGMEKSAKGQATTDAVGITCG